MATTRVSSRRRRTIIRRIDLNLDGDDADARDGEADRRLRYTTLFVYDYQEGDVQSIKTLGDCEPPNFLDPDSDNDGLTDEEATALSLRGGFGDIGDDVHFNPMATGKSQELTEAEHLDDAANFGEIGDNVNFNPLATGVTAMGAEIEDDWRSQFINVDVDISLSSSKVGGGGRGPAGPIRWMAPEAFRCSVIGENFGMVIVRQTIQGTRTRGMGAKLGTIGTPDTASPVRLFSWGLVLD